MSQPTSGGVLRGESSAAGKTGAIPAPLPPDAYDDPCPWETTTMLEEWISERVLRLTCTANDMKQLAKACRFSPSVRKWKPAERAQLMAELDACYFILYGLNREEVIYILSTFQRTRRREADIFESQAQDTALEGLSGKGRAIVEHYDTLRNRSTGLI